MKEEKVTAIVADVSGEQPANKKKVWYLPLTGQEHISYDDRDEAIRKAVRLCAARGVPDTMPLSREEEA